MHAHESFFGPLSQPGVEVNLTPENLADGLTESSEIDIW
jgi:hypothetical protein